MHQVAENNQSFVVEVISIFLKHQVLLHVFGGWAEELTGIRPCSAHKDVDFICVDEGTRKIDSILSEISVFAEIEQKRFSHKRAFMYKGIMIEIFLARRYVSHCYIDLWGRYKICWLESRMSQLIPDAYSTISVVSPDVLQLYRQHYSFVSHSRYKSAQTQKKLELRYFAEQQIWQLIG